MRYFVDYFHYYLLGQHFTVRSDHQALKWLFSFREPKGRIARWLEILSQYDFSIEYRAGKSHNNADAMSRCPNPRECECPEQDNFDDLRCGPCKKCRKRADDMQNALGNPNTVQRVQASNTENTRDWIVYFWYYLMSIVNIGRLLSQKPTKGDTDRQSTIENEMNKTNMELEDDGRLWPKLNINHADQAFDSQTDSRLDRGSPHCCRTNESDPWFQLYTKGKLRQLQQFDLAIGPILKWKETGKRPFGPDICSTSPETRHYWNYWDSLEVKDGLLFKHFHKCNDHHYLQFIVPSAMRKDVLYQMHNSILSAHLGKTKTTEKILQRYYWFECRIDINNWIKKCDVCAANKLPTRKPKGPLGGMSVGAPLDRLATDILGPLPETTRRNKYILVVADSFTRWVEAFPIPDQTAETCANVILNEVIARFGCPLDLHSDQGRNYQSHIFKDLCRLLEIRKTRTTPRHPEGNGQVERFNKTLVPMIRAYIKGQQANWDLNLGCLCAAYRATLNESTGFTPNMLMLGREVRMPGDINNDNLRCETYTDYVENLRNRLHKAHATARQYLKNTTLRQQEHYDGKQMLHQYKAGDLVWCLSEDKAPGLCPKLQMPYKGPYLILEKYNELTYLIQLNGKGTQKVIHYNKLKPYQGDMKLRWKNSALNQFQKYKSEKRDPSTLRE